jgi:hypothetical protein
MLKRLGTIVVLLALPVAMYSQTTMKSGCAGTPGVDCPPYAPKKEAPKKEEPKKEAPKKTSFAPLRAGINRVAV